MPPRVFHDPNLPRGYAPFNIVLVGNRLIVTYAVQDAKKHDDVAGQGHGVVNSFDLCGGGLKRLVSPGQGQPAQFALGGGRGAAELRADLQCLVDREFRAGGEPLTMYRAKPGDKRRFRLALILRTMARRSAWRFRYRAWASRLRLPGVSDG
jgi:hypothetical protein